MSSLGCYCNKPWATTSAGRLAGNWSNEAGSSSSWEASWLVTTWDGRAYSLIENVRQSDYGRASLPVRALEKAILTPIETIVREARERLPALEALPPVVSTGQLDLEVAGPGPEGDLPAETTLSPKASTAGRANKDAPVVSPGVAVAAAAGTAAMMWLVKLLVAPLFSRVRKDSALDQEVRATLQDLIEAEPGIHLNELMRRTKRGAGTVRHHLAKLEDVGLVKSRLGSGFLCYFPTQAGATAMGAAGVTKSDGARRVLAAARAGGTAAELARRTGLAPGTVDYHLARLATAGVVRREGMRWLA